MRFAVHSVYEHPARRVSLMKRMVWLRTKEKAGAAVPFRRRSVAAQFLFLFSAACLAQERPYIVTYDHHLEEPGSLDIEYFSTFGTQPQGNDFHAFWVELEYGAKAWWTTEFYLDG